MKKWKVYGTGLVTLASLCPDVSAQVPGAAAPAPLAPVAAAPAGPPPPALLTFLGLTKDQKDAMKRKCCQTPLGQLLNGMLAPVRMMSGGVVGNFCPLTPSLADQAKPGAAGMAAKIQADEADAKARRAAIRYLGTVDCHFWPEVQDQLILSLRGDRNECVRWEAAMALGGGCCCTKKTIQALLIAATGSNKDEFPPETCERVREAAMASLQHCLACFSQEVPAEPKKPERPEPPGRPPEKPQAQAAGTVLLSAFYQNLEYKTLAQSIQETRQALGEVPPDSSPSTALPSGTHTVFNIISNAMGERPAWRLGAGAVTVQATGMENGTSQPEPIPLSSFAVSAVPEPKPVAAKSKTVETKPTAVSSIKRILSKPSEPAVPEPRPVVAKPETTAVAPAPAPVPRLAAPQSSPAAVPQKQSRAPLADPQPFLAVLRRSIYPFQREWAADSLADADWNSHPEVLSAVLAAAKHDSAPTVRAACVRALVKKHVTSADAVAVVQELRGDPDPRVVHEAVAASPQLGDVQRAYAVESASSEPNAYGQIQPASFNSR